MKHFLIDEFLVALGAEFMLAGKIAVRRADRERRRDGDIGDPVTLQRPFDKLLAGFRA